MTFPARGGPDTAGVDPAEILRQRTLGWPDFHPEDYCHSCGRPNPNWFADTTEWQTATASTEDGGGILCPSCFCALWEQQTGKTAIIWRLSIDPRSRDAGGSDTAGAAREQVARWLSGKIDRPFMWDRSDDAYRAMWLAEADELLSLPAVQRLAVEKAAEELRAAQRRATTRDYMTAQVRVGAQLVADDLGARAAALAAAAQPTDGRTGE